MSCGRARRGRGVSGGCRGGRASRACAALAGEALTCCTHLDAPDAVAVVHLRALCVQQQLTAAVVEVGARARRVCRGRAGARRQQPRCAACRLPAGCATTAGTIRAPACSVYSQSPRKDADSERRKLRTLRAGGGAASAEASTGQAAGGPRQGAGQRRGPARTARSQSSWGCTAAGRRRAPIRAAAARPPT